MSLTEKQIQSRLSKLACLSDLRLGGYLWQSSRDLVELPPLLDTAPPFQQVLRDLDTARATIATVLASERYGPKLRKLIEKCLSEEHT
jgi:hypothetical protein